MWEYYMVYLFLINNHGASIWIIRKENMIIYITGLTLPSLQVVTINYWRKKIVKDLTKEFNIKYKLFRRY